jgi:hypothetical protein
MDIDRAGFHFHSILFYRAEVQWNVALAVKPNAT